MVKNGLSKWRSPSNIALVKYWGKKQEQLPCNPSISFTLNKAHTVTSVKWQYKKNGPSNHVDFTFFFDGQKNQGFKNRIQKYLNRLAEEMAFLTEYDLEISSTNTFPHSSGIASSASAMSAMAAALVDMERQIEGKKETENFLQRISRLSRLGSGSACRSIYPEVAIWGTSSFEESTDHYAVGLESILHPNFRNYHDAILLVDQKEKKVSSSAGHQLMDNNPYGPLRYKNAYENTTTLLSILKTGELADFTTLVEEEALTLHALMMVSSPGYILMHPNTLKIIELVRKYRRDTGIPVCFTLDAGPNVHLLFPDISKKHVFNFIESELVPLCVHGRWINDEMGEGIQKLTDENNT